jgi:biopolymer transport protein ExbB/TolQ
VIDTILTPLKDAMHVISLGFLVPTITILLLFLSWLVVELGGLLVEIFMERRRKKINVPRLIDDFQGKDAEEILEVIRRSCLFQRQKAALGELISYSNLPTASLQALARRLVTKEELHYVRITNRTDLVARLGPMFGLMGTLIPLGPGIIALGQGNTKVLADSLLTAFDTTVTGLIAASVAFFISRLRKRWYEDYLSTMEALMESLLEVFAGERGIEKQKAQDAYVIGRG